MNDASWPALLTPLCSCQSENALASGPFLEKHAKFTKGHGHTFITTTDFLTYTSQFTYTSQSHQPISHPLIHHKQTKDLSNINMERMQNRVRVGVVCMSSHQGQHSRPSPNRSRK